MTQPGDSGSRNPGRPTGEFRTPATGSRSGTLPSVDFPPAISRSIRSHTSRANLRSVAGVFTPSILLTIVIEAVTCLLRFGCRLESTKHTASTIGMLTCGIRIHHGYIGGGAMLLACWLWERFPVASKWLLVVGLALFVSDAVHHFLVLWPVTGSPQFDLVYPQ